MGRVTEWTSSQIAFLHENYPTKGAAWCGEKLARTPKAVENKVRKMGLKIDKTGEHYMNCRRLSAETRMASRQPVNA